MRLCGLRLLVALLTFGAGVAISSLWSFLRAPLVCPRYTSARPLAVSTSETVINAYEVPDPTLPLLAGRPYFENGFYNSGVLNGMALSKPQPDYPKDANGAFGPVWVHVLVNKEGRVIKAEAEFGHPRLRHAAEAAALRARFGPMLLSGERVKFSGVLTYNFDPE